MISEYHITLRLTDAERERLDQLRGSRDLDEFVKDTFAVIVQAPNNQDDEVEEDHLTVEDHLRLIAEAESEPYLELEEIEEHFRQRRIARHAENAAGVA